MTTSTSSSIGLDILLSTLQNAEDVDGTLNILSVLDELLTAGTDRRIYYMIKKGASEALLNALVKFAHTFCPNYTILLPLMHLLAKVGHRDRRIGMKAEETGAVLLILNLLKHNVKHATRAAACLWVIQVFSSSVSTANLIGENHGLDVIFSLIPEYTTKHLHTIRAAINAFAALLRTKANVYSVVSKGYISGLLRLYEDWHNKDTQHVAISICHALLRCLHKVTHITAGRQAFISQGGIQLLYQTTQTCLLNKCLESLVEPSVQLMRKCLPKTPLPLSSDLSAYTFPLPGRPTVVPEVDDEDLETDLNKLGYHPDPHKPKDLLPQYSFLCPELSHDFQELDRDSEPEQSSASSSSDKEAVLLHSFPPHSSKMDRVGSSSSSPTSSLKLHAETEMHTEKQASAGAQLEAQDFHSHTSILSTSSRIRTIVREAAGEGSSGQRGNEWDDEEDEAEESHQCAMIDRILERCGACIPHHEPKLYCATAAKTKSIPGFRILAFPDFWGHLPPTGHEPMAPRKPNIQRQKVLEDIQRFLNNDIINQVVFDLEDSSLQSPSDSLRFFSKFECGNLRKAVQVRRYEYDLILNADANCFQHTQWFYFEVSNMVADTPYRFNVINCEKSNSQFNYEASRHSTKNLESWMLL
ncbi:hypothetical protein Q8A73_005071 [Channa argus]|nr:hypothetical protein Q8A73_005071 [Channa argus]